MSISFIPPSKPTNSHYFMLVQRIFGINGLVSIPINYTVHRYNFRIGLVTPPFFKL